MKIVIPDPIWSVPDKYWDKLRELGAEIYDDAPANQQETVRRIKDAEIITANYLNLDKQLIDAAVNLKYVIVPAVGYNNIDAGYASIKGIKVLNCPTFVPLSVAEHALALIFALAKNLTQTKIDLQDGTWAQEKYLSFELSGKTLGLVGYGNIGKNLERMAAGMGMKVNHTNSKSSDEETDDLFRNSDIVCLCLPLNEQTRHMVDERRLQLLKPTTYLINVSRGAIIDQPALLASLKQKKFAGAGLDVFEDEPGASGQIPAEILELVQLPNVVPSPHIAFNTPEAADRLGQEILSNIQACLNGKPMNIVNDITNKEA